MDSKMDLELVCSIYLFKKKLLTHWNFDGSYTKTRTYHPGFFFLIAEDADDKYLIEISA